MTFRPCPNLQLNAVWISEICPLRSGQVSLGKSDRRRVEYRTSLFKSAVCRFHVVDLEADVRGANIAVAKYEVPTLRAVVLQKLNSSSPNVKK